MSPVFDELRDATYRWCRERSSATLNSTHNFYLSGVTRFRHEVESDVVVREELAIISSEFSTCPDELRRLPRKEYGLITQSKVIELPTTQHLTHGKLRTSAKEHEYSKTRYVLIR